MVPGNLPYSYGGYPNYHSPPNQPPVVVQAPSLPKPSPVQDSSPIQISNLPASPSHYLPGVYFPYGPFYYDAATSAPTPAASEINTAPPASQPPKPPASHYYPQYSVQMPYYPAPTAAPVAQAPAPLPISPPPSLPPFYPPKQPVDSQHSVIPFYPSDPYSSYYHYGQFPYQNLGDEVQPAATSHPTIAPPSPPATTIGMMVPKHPGSPSYPFGYFYPQKPIYPLFSPPLPAKEEPPKPVVPQATCLPYAHIICGYYPYPYYPYYHPPYPPHHPLPYSAVTQYPQTQPPVTIKKPSTTTTVTTPTTTTATTITTSSTPSRPTPQLPYVQCVMGSMDAFLPFAHPDSIQVRGQCLCEWGV